MFSLHERARSLEKTKAADGGGGSGSGGGGGDSWNCSVPYWPEFQPHFPCNNRMDCFAGEDEEGCYYTKPGCQLGQFWMDGRCYVYLESGFRGWVAASSACAELGGALASLNTEREWQGVHRVLKLRSQKLTAFIGLRQAKRHLPRM